MDGNDDTAGHCVRGTRCGQVLEPWTGAILKDGDVGYTLPASHERMGDHIRALPDFFFFLFFPVQQTTSGIGHRVK